MRILVRGVSSSSAHALARRPALPDWAALGLRTAGALEEAQAHERENSLTLALDPRRAPLHLPAGELHELVCTGISCGGQLLLHELLTANRARQRYSALIDGGDRFDPAEASTTHLQGLLWVRCERWPQPLTAADILLRERTFSLIVMDLREVAVTTLRKLSFAPWYRLQRLARQNDSLLLTLTPQALLPGVHTRLELSRPYALRDLAEARATLLQRLSTEVLKQPLSAPTQVVACSA